MLLVVLRLPESEVTVLFVVVRLLFVVERAPERVFKFPERVLRLLFVVLRFPERDATAFSVERRRPESEKILVV